MSSTRRVKPGARRTQDGWASAAEFENLHGLNGNAVANKAALLDDEKKKQLLFFLQAMSLREGGIKLIARELVAMFPERIGTATMAKIGCRPGKKLTQAERDKIYEELFGRRWDFLNLGRADEQKRGLSADEFCQECAEQAEQTLDEFIERLCCDPKLAPFEEREAIEHYAKIARIVFEGSDREEEVKGEIKGAALPYFHNILPTLFDYKAQTENSLREKFVETSIGKIVFEALDYALQTGRSVLIEGESGIGKTTAIKAWCSLHMDRARHVQLKGITHRTGFFREVSRALGVARGSATSTGKIQMRTEHFLQRTKMMLVIDEGQYLLPPGNRVGTPPELINWLNTACYNESVPFAISATSEFRARRAIVEKNTTWQSEQLRRRIRRYFPLPAVPTEDDLRRVARKLLPDTTDAAIEYVVGYSLLSRGFFQAITNAIEDAQLVASKDGRQEIKFSDLKAAIQDWRSPSDAALGRIFEEKPPQRRQRRQAIDSASAAEPIKNINGPLNRDLGPVGPLARREIFPIHA